MTNGDAGTRDKKDFDLVLFGATGFTGRLVAEALLRKRAGVRWALAGRSRDKLERVRGELSSLDPAAKDLPLVVGDSLDPASVDAMVQRTRVVCTTVGPYARYGRALVAACAERGAHYCDLTGEPHFIRDVIDRHHARALQTGARIVPSCGFDSIPSDLGVFMLNEHLKQQGDRLAEAHLHVRRMRGGPSGGTAASIFEVMEAAKDPAVRRVLSDPYSLVPDGERGPDGREQLGPRLDGERGRWTAPFLMAAPNTRTVRRSNALLGYAYGRGFRYDESFDTGRGLLGFARAASVSAGIAAFAAVAISAPGRKLLARFLPAPGEGPSRQEQERGLFEIEIHARSEGGQKLTGRVAGDRDPGYGSTSIMLAEAALSLAQDTLPDRGGVLTTASCMGHALIDRLRAAGMTFRVE